MKSRFEPLHLLNAVVLNWFQSASSRIRTGMGRPRPVWRRAWICLGIAWLWAGGVLFAANKQTVGWVEDVVILPERLTVRAKVDTGAENSSLHLSEHRRWRSSGVEYIRFSVIGLGGREQVFTRPIVSTATIKRHFGERQYRPVIELVLCLGQVRRRVPVTLVDRTGFVHALLLGRSFLAGSFLVDPGSQDALTTDCAG